VMEIQTETESETRLAKMIPAMKASENHISGSCVVSRSGMRGAEGGLIAVPIGFPLFMTAHSNVAGLHDNESGSNFICQEPQRGIVHDATCKIIVSCARVSAA
jgi:hypothetical protein